MTTPAGRRGSFFLVALLLVISIILEQCWIVRLLPWISGLGGVQPMIVFLDIPLKLPVIDWVPVSLLFVILYLIVVTPELRLRREPLGGSLWRKAWAVLAGWWFLLACLAAGGGLYYLLEEHLPRQVRNGIDSFGIRADIALPYPGDQVVHLHGAILLLIGLLVGGRFLLKQMTLGAVEVEVKAEEETAAPAMPCIVDGKVTPAVFRVKDSRRSNQLV